MSTLTPFSQSELVAGTTQRKGICVALCDLWLRLIKLNPGEDPHGRLGQLRLMIPQALHYQDNYAGLRAIRGRTAARQQVAGNLGLHYVEQTTVSRRQSGMSGIRQKLASDIGYPGAAATWTLEFEGGSRHAVAGFCGIGGQEPILRLILHLFDPNVGEYRGELRELNSILDDLLGRFPVYHTVKSVCRTWEGS